MAKQTNSPLWENLFRKPPTWLSQATELWAQTPLFRDIRKSDIRALAKNMHPRSYKKDEIIFRAGEHGAGAALIQSGNVEVRAGKKVLAKLGSGDFFGEMALVLEETRTADAVATEPTEIIFFLRADLEEWIARSPATGARIATNIAVVLAERLRRTNELLSQ